MKHSCLGLLVAASLFGASLFTANAQQAAQSNVRAALNRPETVPEGYVITPAGYFHPSCVQTLAKGERLLADGRLQHSDGSVEQSAAACNYPRYTRSGEPVSSLSSSTMENPSLLPEVTGWLENANVSTGSPTKAYGALIAHWTVPPQPRKNDGQTLFFFPGFEDIDGTQSILQPVLRWAGGQWDIESWNCCLNNIVTESPVVYVEPGHRIYSSVTSACASGTLSCSTWNVLTLDMTTGESTTLSNTPSDGQVFNWAFGGVMEPYYVISCEDYPPDWQISFEAVRLFDENLKEIANPKWSDVSNTTATPQCSYAVKSEAHQITLDY
jgi:hypothetical protein